MQKRPLTTSWRASRRRMGWVQSRCGVRAAATVAFGVLSHAAAPVAPAGNTSLLPGCGADGAAVARTPGRATPQQPVRPAHGFTAVHGRVAHAWGRGASGAWPQGAPQYGQRPSLKPPTLHARRSFSSCTRRRRATSRPQRRRLPRARRRACAPRCGALSLVGGSMLLGRCVGVQNTLAAPRACSTEAGARAEAASRCVYCPSQAPLHAGVRCELMRARATQRACPVPPGRAACRRSTCSRAS